LPHRTKTALEHRRSSRSIEILFDEELRRRADEIEGIPKIVRDDAEHLLASVREHLGAEAPLALRVVGQSSVQRSGRRLREE
jgi:hypothetical protein